MKPIHPQIQKYWEDHFNQEILLSSSNSICGISMGLGLGDKIVATTYAVLKIWFPYEKDNPRFLHLQDDDWVYFLNGSQDEETMLRMLKLRAFL